ncbi:MAG TPA: hypothetical protein VFC84_10005 [Desulfosporosinus sp.]|nr:hypothetical protein [Desulfosporosinus sp.]
MKEFKWIKIQRLLLRFISMFAISGVLILGYNFFFLSSEIDYAGIFYLAVGVSFGMTFADLLTKKGINK